MRTEQLKSKVRVAKVDLLLEYAKKDIGAQKVLCEIHKEIKKEAAPIPKME